MGGAGLAYHLAAGDDAARLQDPPHFGEHGPSIRHVYQYVMAVGHVEEAVLEGEFRHIAQVEYRVLLSALLSDDPRQFNLRLLHIHTVQLSGVNGLCQPHGYGAGATAEIEDTKTGPEIWRRCLA